MSTPPLHIQLAHLAEWLEYPRCHSIPLRPGHSSAAFDRFLSAVSALTPDQLEELYTATFDVAPSCVPYVSIYLFGEENFKRGEFMAALQARYQQAEFSTGGELPDHVSILLKFAAQIDESERRELIEYCLLGPMEIMAESLAETNPYRFLLEAIRNTLSEAYPGMRPAPNPAKEMQQHGANCGPICAGRLCGVLPVQDHHYPETLSSTAPVSPAIAGVTKRGLP